MSVRKWGVWLVRRREVRSVKKCGVWMVGGREVRSVCEKVGSVGGMREGS